MLPPPRVRAISERGGARRIWRIRANAVCAALLGLTGWIAAAPSAAQSEARGADAVLIGSSSFNQPFGQLIARQLQRRGYQVTRKGVNGAGLARPDFRDMSQVLESLPVGPETAAVFVYLGVNDAQDLWLYPRERSRAGSSSIPFGAAEWDAAYARRTREFLERICQRGARRAVVLLPVDVNRPDLQRRLERIRALQAQAAAETRCAVAVRTGGDQGRFEVDGVPVRLPDGFHMSARGAELVWGRIEAQVLQLLEPSAPGRVAAAR
ncbi:MAG TPA: GDSL-type esterase/lipase family protein [Polyangiaceae bacterium]|nr:GDSL-type esterase/lipase family protein [Polyangiaceae bacterium]